MISGMTNKKHAAKTKKRGKGRTTNKKTTTRSHKCSHRLVDVKTKRKRRCKRRALVGQTTCKLHLETVENSIEAPKKRKRKKNLVSAKPQRKGKKIRKKTTKKIAKRHTKRKRKHKS